MQLRRRFTTKYLSSLVAPSPLKDALQELVLRGDLEWYELGKYRTTIKLTKTTDLSTILKEASAPITNPRPYVANKSNDPWKIRKLKP